jgi:hypothetical protein
MGMGARAYPAKPATGREAEGIRENVVKYGSLVALAFGLGILPIAAVQADMEDNDARKLQPIGQKAQQTAQAGERVTSAKSIEPPIHDYKWLIRSPEEDSSRMSKPANDERNRNIRTAQEATAPYPAKADAGKKPPSTSYYRRADSYATNPESDPPRYVRKLSETGIEAFKDITWLDIGFEFRTRYEMRHNDIRRVEGGFDNPFFLRSRAYLGIREILDPFRFAVEFQDSRVYNNRFPTTDQENNPYDLIQGYGELYFKHGLGEDDRKQSRPIRFRVGRMAYETLDRRFIARNEWRNTTNAFEGFRLNLGQEANDWEIDLWGHQPVRRLQTRFDEANGHLWFFGAIGHWRKWSDIITLQPYYMGQKQTADPNGHTATNRLDREIHMPSLRGYGRIGDTGLDFDVNFSYQFGMNGDQRHDAYGYTIEVGQTFKHAWKPRLSGFYGYATGDRNPDDDANNRFDRFFGFARPWSADHYVIYENIKAPKAKLDFQPTQKLGVEVGYSWFWLASSTDRLFDSFDGNISVVRDPGFNRDRTGRSGDEVGSALETRLRYQLASRVSTIVGYTHFTAGDFVKNVIAAHPEEIDRRSGNTDFFYFEVLISAF